MSKSFATRRSDRLNNRKIHRRAWAIVAVACAPTMVGLQSAHAASGVWINTTSGGLWSSPGNWNGGTIANGIDSTADFSTLNLAGSNTVHLDSPRTIGTINFGDQGSQYGWTLDGNGSLTNVLTLQTSTGAPSINVVNQTTTISAPIAGTQGFTKTGAGSLLLTGANTYSGVTNISNGTLILGTAANTAAPAAGAVLDIDPTQSTIVTNGSGQVTSISDLANSSDSVNASGLGGPTIGSINGHKALAYSGSGLLTSFTSGTNPATVFAVVYPTSVSDGGIVGSNSTNGLLFRIDAGKLDMVENGIYDANNHSVGSVPTGTPTVVALAFNSSSGTYYINGTSQGSTGSNALGLGGSNNLTIGYQYSYGGYNDEFQGDIGTILVYNSVLSTSAMATTLSFLQQEYASASSVTGTSLINLSNAAGSLSINSSSASISSLSGVANSNVYLGNGILTVGSDNTSTVYAGNISDTGPGTTGTGGQLVKTGTGMLTLSGAVGNTGGLQVNAGKVLISSTYNSSGPTAVTGGTLSITGTDSSTGPNTISGGTFSISGTQSTTGNFVITSGGTLSLSGNSTATGSVTVSNGATLQLIANTGNINTGTSTSSAIGSPSAVLYADNTNTANIQLRGDGNITFANSGPTGGTGGYPSGTTINFDVNNLGGTDTTTGMTLGIGSTTGGTSGFATYKTTINVTGGNNYSLSLPPITEAYGQYVTLNANTANLAMTGGVADVGLLTVGGAMNTSLGAITGTSGSLAKIGAGTLTLTGSNTYPGSTTIAAGSVVLTSAASLASTSGISIGSGATFDISNNSGFALSSSTAMLSGSGTLIGPYNHSVGVLSPGGNGTVGTLNVSNGLSLTGGSLYIDLSGSNNSTGGIYNDLINVTGALTLAGNTTINLGPVTPTLSPGTEYTIATASGGLNLGTGTLNVSSTAFSVVTTANAIELKYNSGTVGADVWNGSNGTNWDTSTQNFVPLGSTSLISFSNGDNVTFNDSSTVLNVSLASSLSPSSVTVSSNTSNYTFSGSGFINGSGGLLKTGSSILTISTANTYTGTTNVAGGTVILNNTSGVGLGTGPLIIGTGAMVQVGDGGADGAIANGNTDTNTITDNGVLAFNSSSTNLNPPVLITGTGSLFINASIGIGNHNTYSGGTNIAGGNVIGYENDSFGTGLVTVNGGTLNVQFGAVFANNFNLSGNALADYNYGGTGVLEIDGLVNLTGDTTVQEAYQARVTFGNTVTSTGANLILAAGGNGVTFEKSVSLGTGQIETSTTVILNPAVSTTITVSSAITGSGSVVHSGAGTSVLSGSNTYSGGTTVSAGTLVLASGAAFPASSNLAVASGATVQIASHAHGAAASLVVVGQPTNNGTIDITNNAIDIQTITSGVSDVGTIYSQIAAAYNGGLWTGTSTTGGIITSSAAASDTKHLTAVGEATGLSTFEGQSVSSTDVLVKYTYYGDANLDGKVDGSDYSLIDNGYLMQLTGWQNGDFNYDGVINGSDYTLIDNAFNTQGAQLAAETASPTAQIAGGASAVPEPSVLGLIGFGVAGLLGRRRRQ